MLATLNAKENDPHDALDISPDVVLASRSDKQAPTLAPEIASPLERKIQIAADQVAADAASAAPSVDTAVRAALHDYHTTRTRSSIGNWFGRAFLTLLFAGGSAAAAIAWQAHGDTVTDMVTAWIPALTASPSQAPAEQPASSAPQAVATDDTAAQAAAPVQQPDGATATAAAVAPEATQSLQSMAHDLAAMGQQIEQLKATVAELKAGQEQMAREIAKPPPAKPSDARGLDPHARMSALPPRPPTASVRKPKPGSAPAATPTSAPAPIAPAPPQAAYVPPPPAPAPLLQQTTADDNGPIVRPPMPVR